jgi:plastocyanin
VRSSRIHIGWLAVLLLLAVFTLGADSDPPGTEVVVAFNRHRFEPAAVEVRLGARVTFHNMDVGDSAYTVVATDGAFESRPLSTHGEWGHRFKVRGEHGFFIKEAPETQGSVKVE